MLHLQRAKTDWNGCCQVSVQGALWLAKRYPSILILVFLTGFCYCSYQVAIQLSSQGWVDPIPDPTLPTLTLLHLLHSSVSTPPIASPMSQLILQPFQCFPYITGTSPMSSGDLPMLGSWVHVSVTPCGFCGGWNGAWVGFSRGLSHLPYQKFHFTISWHISSISFHQPL